MAIKEIPTTLRVYFKAMKDAIRPKYEKSVGDYENLFVEEKAMYSEIKSNLSNYKDAYKVNLMDYEEFVNNEYSTGTFYNDAKGLFINKKNNYKATSPLYKLYKLARQQKELKELKANIDLYETMLDLELSQYKKIVEQYYNEVLREMIVNGNGYVFEQPMGWLCINRCKIVHGKSRLLDFKATRLNKEKLLNEGKRLWNKEEAEYAARIGVEYNGVDYRVFKNEEYAYEFALINCRITGEDKMDFKPVDTHKTIREDNEDEIIKSCDGDVNKICRLSQVNPRRKLKLCLKADELLYLNFIRNEAQQTAHTPKANRKG